MAVTADMVVERQEAISVVVAAVDTPEEAVAQVISRL